MFLVDSWGVVKKKGAGYPKRRMKIIKKLVLYVASIPLLVPCVSGHARDLQGRLGLGYNSEFANFTAVNGVPGISIKYGFSREIGTELIFGTATTSPGNTVAAVKFFKNLFYETNLNFYIAALS